jgi:hypothetical protein
LPLRTIQQRHFRRHCTGHVRTVRTRCEVWQPRNNSTT